MQYIVRMERTMVKTAIVEADSVKDLSEKLGNGEYKWVQIKKAPKVVGAMYGNWRLVHAKAVTGEVFKNVEDVAKFYGVGVEDLGRAVYDNTESGLGIVVEANGIILCGYTEMDGDTVTERLEFPITAEEWERAVNKVDDMANQLYEALITEDEE